MDNQTLKTMESVIKKSIARRIINGFFLILLNIVLMSIIGYMTLDHDATMNSRFGAFLLSILIPYFFVSKTKDMDGIERMLKFGIGFIIYIVLVLIRADISHALLCGILPCLLISIGLLYGGNNIFRNYISI